SSAPVGSAALRRALTSARQPRSRTSSGSMAARRRRTVAVSPASAAVSAARARDQSPSAGASDAAWSNASSAPATSPARLSPIPRRISASPFPGSSAGRPAATVGANTATEAADRAGAAGMTASAAANPTAATAETIGETTSADGHYFIEGERRRPLHVLIRMEDPDPVRAALKPAGHDLVGEAGASFLAGTSRARARDDAHEQLAAVPLHVSAQPLAAVRRGHHAADQDLAPPTGHGRGVSSGGGHGPEPDAILELCGWRERLGACGQGEDQDREPAGHGELQGRSGARCGPTNGACARARRHGVHTIMTNGGAPELHGGR